MAQFYTDPGREPDPWALPDAEVFHVSEEGLGTCWYDDEGDPLPPGWYY